MASSCHSCFTVLPNGQPPGHGRYLSAPLMEALTFFNFSDKLFLHPPQDDAARTARTSDALPQVTA